MGIKCTQCSLVFINTFFGVFGIIFFIFGCLIKFGSSSFEDYVIDKLSGTLSFMRSAGSNGNLVNFDLSVYLSPLALGLLALGSFFIVVSFFGCCGGIGKIRCFLMFYASIIVFLIIVEVAVLIAVTAFEEEMTNFLRKPMLDSLTEGYHGINGTDVISAGWNVLMVVFECCGVNNHEDFQSADEWTRKVTLPGQPINASLGVTSQPITVLLSTPITCCKWTGTIPQIRLPEENNINCAISPTNANSNKDRGCVSAIVNYIEDHYVYISCGAAVICLCQFIMLLIVICLLQAMKRRRDMDKEVQRMFRDE